ncbi:hypothetical protein [Kribbella sp. CA-294648]|uniref:hypothetical protein n=1 Tax=Kribbella sp. CA-294648 TaxID=3239948 RepID=UPI003D8E8A5B
MRSRAWFPAIVAGVIGAAAALGGLGIADALPLSSTSAVGPAAVPSPGPGAFQPVTPVRVLTTQQSSGKIKAGETRVISIPQVPFNATAVSISVTAIKGSASGYLKVFPAGEAQPVSSTVSYSVGQIIANHATIKLGIGNKLAIFNSAGSLDVNVDLQGFYRQGSVGRFTDGYIKVLPNGSMEISQSTEGPATSVKTNVGRYRVTFPGGYFGSAVVSPNTTLPGIGCAVASVTTSIDVACYDSTNKPIDVGFSMVFSV